MKVEFIPYEFKEPIEKELLEKLLSVEERRIGILTTAQHLSQALDVVKFLNEHGKEAIFGGQVLGCNLENVEKLEGVDCFLYVGTGQFHPAGIYMAGRKRVYVLNPLSKAFGVFDESLTKKYEVRREVARQAFREARKVGFLVSVKPGQFNLKRAMELKEKFKDKEVYIFLFDTIIPEELINFPSIDVWVNFACPRIFDDYERFPKPILNWKDVTEEGSEGREE